MWYSVGDLADLLGITTAAVRFLESKGIIAPHKDESGRRFYRMEDIFRLLSYSKYKSMKIPLKEIGRQFTENDRAMIRSRIAAARDHALEQARYYQELAQSIQEHVEHIDRIDQLLDRYEFEKSPPWLFLSDRQSGWISQEKDRRKLMNRWVEAMPHVQLAALSRYPSRIAQLGYLVPEEKAEGLGLPLGPMVQRLPSQSCLHTIRVADAGFPNDPNQVFDEAVRYAEHRGLLISGTMAGSVILVETAGELLRVYVELWIPVC